MTGAELSRIAASLGLDVVGAARAEPYEETERLIHERRSRGLFADMKFAMARPEVSCHPELLLEAHAQWLLRGSAISLRGRAGRRRRSSTSLHVAGRVFEAARATGCPWPNVGRLVPGTR
jgi:hypothetical protein